MRVEWVEKAKRVPLWSLEFGEYFVVAHSWNLTNPSSIYCEIYILCGDAGDNKMSVFELSNNRMATFSDTTMVFPLDVTLKASFKE